ncbi:MULTISPECIES: hypothetical protein [unclassified Neisseria]|uniref:hypothetical protein n=1 Tax=unclassified Neisseria TaxID=2623750 RepID=UPI001072A961|nr:MULTISPECIES: hypothetical protein [unclassified Neisseria]MBF0803946.1 hypothetical protein [Neisseria sp. 19428wB4_WF04]TFU43372.1 hypothetical protein E4T99_06185 [Neisseria sp. WF04]
MTGFLSLRQAKNALSSKPERWESADTPGKAPCGVMDKDIFVPAHIKGHLMMAAVEINIFAAYPDRNAGCRCLFPK